MTTENLLYTSFNDRQEIHLHFVDDRCDWKKALAELGYHSRDVHRRITLESIFLDDEVGGDVEVELGQDDRVRANLVEDFGFELNMGDGYGTLHLTNKEGVVTLEGGTTDFLVTYVRVLVESTLYLGEIGLIGNPRCDIIAEIVRLRAFMKDIDVPVYTEKDEPIQYITPSPDPWLGLYNEAVHEIRALREELKVDFLQCEGDAPWSVVEFFRQAQLETPKWFYGKQEALGHVAMWFEYDAARRFCMQAMGSQGIEPNWRPVFAALYQVFACSTSNIIKYAREPFFKHVRGVFRKHKAVVESSPSLEILASAYYDYDYLNIFGGVKTGTVQYMQHLEYTVHGMNKPQG